MTKAVKAYFAETFPGLTHEEACQSILDELNDLESHTGYDTGSIKTLVETLLDDLCDSYSDDEEEDDEMD